MLKATLKCLGVALAASTLWTAPAAADLADLIPTLFGTRIVLAPPAPGFPSHEAHFLDESLALAATGRTLNASLLEQISAFPLASSAGGFTYTFDPALGTFTRTTESFGPVYTERAQTIGRGKWNLGFSYQQASYDQLDDIGLEEGGIQFQLAHVDDPPGSTNPPNPFFEGDVIGVREFIQLDSSTAVLYANYGVSDRFDLSIAVPLVTVDIDARAQLSINRLSTPAQPGIHRFADGSSTAEFRASDSASGIGDAVVRGKLRFLGTGGGGLAMAVDVRLPTGDEQDLLGTGTTQGKLSLIGSAGAGRFGVHGNVGYSVASGEGDVVGEVPDELSYAVALDVALHPRITVAGEVVGRTLFDATRAVVGQETFTFREGATGPVRSTSLPVVSFAQDDVQLLFGALGVKFNPAGNLLLSVDALFPLGEDGLQQDGVIAVAGAEYSF